MTRDISADMLYIRNNYGIELTGTCTVSAPDYVTVSALTVPDNALVGRTLTISGSTGNDGTYNILANTSTVITLDAVLTADSGNYTIPEYTELITELDAIDAVLDASVPKHRCYGPAAFSNKNEYFSRFEEIPRAVVGHNTKYNIPTRLDTAIGTLTTFVLEDNSTYLTHTLLAAYKGNLNVAVSLIETIGAEIDGYVTSLKNLSELFSIAELKIKGENYSNILSALSPADQTVVQVYLDEIDISVESYRALKKTDIAALKI